MIIPASISLHKQHMLKLLLISHGLDGGINRVTSDLHAFFRADDSIDSTIIRIGEGREGMPAADAEGQEYNVALKSTSKNIALRIGAWIAGLNDIRRLVGKKKYDVIVYSGIIPAILMAHTLRHASKTHVFWEHGPQKTFLKPKRIITSMLPRFAGVMSPAQSSLDWLRQNLNIKATKFCVISNWVNWQKITPAAEDRITGNIFKMAVISRIDYRQKDFETLLLAISELVKSGTTSIMVDIYGTGEDLPKIEASIAQLQLSSYVALKGHTNQIYSLLPGYDISILPTKWEGFGLSIAESMAARVIPVSAAVEGVVDVIDDKVTGFLYRPGDAGSLSKIIRETMLLSDHQRQTIRDAGRTKVIEQYTPTVQFNKIKSFLNQTRSTG